MLVALFVAFISWLLEKRRLGKPAEFTQVYSVGQTVDVLSLPIIGGRQYIVAQHPDNEKDIRVLDIEGVVTPAETLYPGTYGCHQYEPQVSNKVEARRMRSRRPKHKRELRLARMIDLPERSDQVVSR